MPFQQDIEVESQAGQSFGKYHSTFRSQNGQVQAQIFERNGELIAYVSFPTGAEPTEVTDPYVGELNRYAAEHGFDRKLRIIYSR